MAAAVGLLALVVAVPVLLLARGSWPAALAGLAVLWAVPGCGLAAWLTLPDRLVRAVLGMAGGLTWGVLVSAGLAWGGIQSVPLVFAATGGLGGLACAASLMPARQLAGLPSSTAASTASSAASSAADAAEDVAPGGARRSAVMAGRRWPSVLLIVALGLWLVSLAFADGPVGDYGLLPKLGVPFGLAVVTTIAAIVLSLRDRVWNLGAAAGSAALILMLNATPGLVAGLPLEAWAYKHLGVVDYIVRGEPLHDVTDIYQQWPGFFAAAAALVKLTGVAPVIYYDGARVFFELLNAVTLFAIARVVSRGDDRVAHVAVLLFVACNWEGQRYYSPQTLAFLLAMALQLLGVLTVLGPPVYRRGPLWLRRWLGWLTADVPRAHRTSPGLARVVGVLSCVIFAAIIISHQLTPFMVLASAVPLALLGLWQMRVAVLVMAVMAITYVLAHKTSLSGLPVLSGFHLSNVSGTVTVKVKPTSEQQVFAADLAHAVALGTWGATAAAVLSYLRRPGRIVVPAVLAFMPISLVALQSYGGEAIYRVFLMSSPWCAVILAIRVCDLTWSASLRRVLLIGWATFLALGSAQAATFGMYDVLSVATSDVAASHYFLDHAEPGTVLTQASSNFPGRLDGRYVLHNRTHTVNDPALLDDRQIRVGGLARVDAETLAVTARKASGQCRGYLVVGPFLDGYTRYFGQPPGTREAVTRQLSSSSAWRLWYRNGQTSIFETTSGRPHCETSGRGGDRSHG